MRNHRPRLPPRPTVLCPTLLNLQLSIISMDQPETSIHPRLPVQAHLIACPIIQQPRPKSGNHRPISKLVIKFDVLSVLHSLYHSVLLLYLNLYVWDIELLVSELVTKSKYFTNWRAWVTDLKGDWFDIEQVYCTKLEIGIGEATCFGRRLLSARRLVHH